MRETRSNKKVKRVSPTQIGFIAVGLIILGIVVWFTPWVHLDNSPKPLGDRLEFIGKFDYGCGGFIGVCDAAPGAEYFYATDMSLEEVVRYFRAAKTGGEPDVLSEYTSIWLYRNDKENGFSVYYYKEEHMDTAKREQLGLEKTNKQHSISIDAKYYSIAKDSL